MDGLSRERDMAGGSYIETDGVLHEPEGHAALWQTFGLSRASWAVLPRSLMHEMPDEWQAKMAVLLDEFHDTYRNAPDLDYSVSLSQRGKFVRLPDWLNYRHPDVNEIESFKCA